MPQAQMIEAFGYQVGTVAETLGAIGTVGTLAATGLILWAQRQDRLREYARQVKVRATKPEHPLACYFIEITNQSPEPIFNVRLECEGAEYLTERDYGHLLPGAEVRHPTGVSKEPKFFLTFEDYSGQRWWRHWQGRLRRLGEWDTPHF